MSSPLVVDLDGTLLRSDLLIESALGYIGKDCRALLMLPIWLFQGRATLKEQLADNVPLDVSLLPYHEGVLAMLRDAKMSGRAVILATASHQRFADEISRHLGLFDRVIATNGRLNLKAGSKRDRLVEEFGEYGFDYIGNSHADLPVWASAGKSYLADPGPGVERRARRQGDIAAVLFSRNGYLQPLMKALRPYQWLKNLLVFIPLLAAHQLTSLSMAAAAFLAFVLFSATASSGYLLNDLLDLEHDRHHDGKKSRPLASGDLPVQVGIVAAPILMCMSLTVSLWLMPLLFTVALVIYAVLTVAYSQTLKKLAGVDTIVLALLYTLRIIAGAFACGLVPTFWILAFSMFLFLSLAMVKRYSELYDARQKGLTTKTKGRGYYPADLEIISSLGTASGYLSVLVLALYIQDQRTAQLYAAYELIWLSCPLLLFWISRVWLVTHRGEMHDDPVLFAIKDKVSVLVGGGFALIFIFAMIL